MAANNQLNIYFGDKSKPPYDQHSDALTLSTFNAAVLGQLITSPNGLELQPGHLETFHFDPTDLSYTLRLKGDIYFHNGRLATSKDLVYSLLRGFFSKDRSFFSTYLDNIAGLESIPADAEYNDKLVSGVKIIDSRTISVKLKAPNPSFLHSLTEPYFSLVPREALQQDNLTWKSIPIGAGPYKVQKEFDGEKTELVKAENSQFSKSPDKVLFYNKKPARVDITEGPNEDVELIDYKVSLPASVRLLSISNKNPLSKNIHFKKAINFAINRELFKSKKLGVSPTTQLLPKHFWGRTEEKKLFNLEKAKRLFSKIPEDLRNRTYEIPVFAGGEFSNLQLHYIKRLEFDFRSIGFKTKFVKNNEKFETIETALKSPLFCWGVVSDYIDPLVMFSAFKKNGFSPYYSPTGEEMEIYESLYQKASNAIGFKNRNEAVKKLSEFVKKEAIIIPIAEEAMFYSYNEKSVASIGSQNHPTTFLVTQVRMSLSKENKK